MGNLTQKKESIITPEQDLKNELNIFTCGDTREIKLFNQKEISRENFMEQDSDYFEENHPIKISYNKYYQHRHQV